MVHSFRIPEGIDYVKLPCLTRSSQDGYSSKFLNEDPKSLLKMRSDLILSATSNFQPDLIMVDKKPYGVENELLPTFRYLQEYLPHTKLTLVLRDILDSPKVTQEIWNKNGLFDAIETYYDELLVLGTPEVFDPRSEYAFSRALNAKTSFCGYLRREPGLTDRATIRSELGLTDEEPFVLVTAGGGEDGMHVFENYLKGMSRLSPKNRLKSLMIFGPEMADDRQNYLRRWADQHSRIRTMSFTNDLMSYMDAANLVVSMGGYGTICEILSLNKPAVVVPRVKPVEEQWIRASRMAKLGLLNTIHPDDVTPEGFMETVQAVLHNHKAESDASRQPNLDALPNLTLSVLNHLMKGNWQENFMPGYESQSLMPALASTSSPSYGQWLAN